MKGEQEESQEEWVPHHVIIVTLLKLQAEDLLNAELKYSVELVIPLRFVVLLTTLQHHPVSSSASEQHVCAHQGSVLTALQHVSETHHPSSIHC